MVEHARGSLLHGGRVRGRIPGWRIDRGSRLASRPGRRTGRPGHPAGHRGQRDGGDAAGGSSGRPRRAPDQRLRRGRADRRSPAPRHRSVGRDRGPPPAPAARRDRRRGLCVGPRPRGAAAGPLRRSHGDHVKTCGHRRAERTQPRRTKGSSAPSTRSGASTASARRWRRCWATAPSTLPGRPCWRPSTRATFRSCSRGSPTCTAPVAGRRSDFASGPRTTSGCGAAPTCPPWTTLRGSPSRCVPRRVSDRRRPTGRGSSRCPWRVSPTRPGPPVCHKHTGGVPALAALPELATLTSREWEVAGALAQGSRVTTIAQQLHVSPGTVRNHLSAVYRKLDVGSQAELLERLRAG